MTPEAEERLLKYLDEQRRDEKHMVVVNRLDQLSASSALAANAQLAFTAQIVVLTGQILEHEKTDQQHHRQMEKWCRDHEENHHSRHHLHKIVEDTYDDVSSKHELASFREKEKARGVVIAKAVATLLGAVAIAIAGYLTHGWVH